jgi:hypothetical protein
VAGKKTSGDKTPPPNTGKKEERGKTSSDKGGKK